MIRATPGWEKGPRTGLQHGKRACKVKAATGSLSNAVASQLRTLKKAGRGDLARGCRNPQSANGARGLHHEEQPRAPFPAF
ncbi:hypothetical protein NDU88_007051 [Pleurodeles waltl]|uniref:Uncharacterized protein n=1 Tax=Pleurodeles waltl TaxID=8319 RepID=A0AAV7N2D0_PLEWA|nr:hypothetical protein NDU88_007051 [Pleurodeles waltl]